MNGETAARRRTFVRLNLAELNVLLEAGLATSGRRKPKGILGSALRRVERARDRRLRAVERAARK